MQLVILYTANIRGDLDLLPRLYTFIRQLRSRPILDETDVMLCPVEPVIPRTLLLDLGESCAPEVWHCAATQGRSTLMVLDSMGYDAANVSLSAEAHARLAANPMHVELVDADHSCLVNNILLTAQPAVLLPNPHRLQIVLTPADSTRLEKKVLSLAAVQAGQVGMAQVNLDLLRLEQHALYDLPAHSLPDPTIAGIVEFVSNEARYYQNRR